MKKDRIPRQGEIYQHFKDKPYQIVAIATHSETRETMVVYQALYGDFKTYVRPLDMFMSEVDKEKYPDAKQERRFELRKVTEAQESILIAKVNGNNSFVDPIHREEEQLELKMSHDTSGASLIDTQIMNAEPTKSTDEKVNHILLEFLDAKSYNKKLEVISSNLKHMNDRLINDMAVSLDCTVDEGPLEHRVQELVACLQAMSRFEDRRLR